MTQLPTTRPYALGHPYSVAAISVGVVILLKVMLQPVVEIADPSLIWFLGAVMVSARYGGVRSGIVATALSVCLSFLYIFPHSLNLDVLLRISLFLGEGMVISRIFPVLTPPRSQAKASTIPEEIRKRKFTLEQRNIFPNQQERLQDILNLMPTPLLLIEPGTAKVTFANRAADEMAGGEFPKDKAGEEYHEAYYCTDARGKRIPNEQMPGVRVARGEKLNGIEMDWHTPGGVRSLIVFADTLPAMHGYPALCIVSFQDVSRLKRTERELKESEERFRHMASVAPVMIWMSGTDKLCNFFNQPWLKFTGRTMDEEMGNGWTQGVHPDDFDDCLEIYTTAFDKREPFKMEYRLRRYDGEYRWILDAAVPRYSPNGEFLGFIGSCLDISDRKKAEVQLRQLNETLEQRVQERTAQLQEVNQELESFCYSVSHDLRAPFRHIIGFVDLLEKHSADQLDPTSQRYLTIIRKAAKDAGILVDDLLAFSRMARTEMSCRAVNMNLLIEEVIKALQFDTAERLIDWKISPLPIVEGDPAMLRLVIQNLLSNAIKYTSNCSQAKITIGSRETPHEHIFYVQDNGVGFDMRYIEKLFGVFQRLHSETEFTGTGIGLANVQRIINRHGGRTWAEGEVNAGATFYFSLPKPLVSLQPSLPFQPIPQTYL